MVYEKDTWDHFRHESERKPSSLECCLLSKGYEDIRQRYVNRHARHERDALGFGKKRYQRRLGTLRSTRFPETSPRLHCCVRAPGFLPSARYAV